MARWLKQSTSVDVPIGPFLDATDGVTAETSLTLTQPDIRLKKNGGAWAQKAAAQTLSHEENGNYEVTLDATDTNTLGLLRLHVADSGALPVWEDFLVVPANVWDSLFGADNLQVDVTHVAGSATTATLDTIKGDTAAILTDTAEIGAAGAGLTEAGGTGDHLTALATQTSVNDLPTNSELATALTPIALEATLTTIAGYLDTEVAAILADTNELQTDWANGGRLDLILDARASQASVDDLPTNAELATALGTADDAVLAAVATVDSNVDAIKAKTDSLTFTVAGQVDANIESVNGTTVTGSGTEGDPWGP